MDSTSAFVKLPLDSHTPDASPSRDDGMLGVGMRRVSSAGGNASPGAALAMELTDAERSAGLLSKERHEPSERPSLAWRFMAATGWSAGCCRARRSMACNAVGASCDPPTAPRERTQASHGAAEGKMRQAWAPGRPWARRVPGTELLAIDGTRPRKGFGRISARNLGRPESPPKPPGAPWQFAAMLASPRPPVRPEASHPRESEFDCVRAVALQH